MADLGRALTLLAIVSVAVPAIGQNGRGNAFPQVGELPLGFERNVGQTDPSVRYLVHSGRQTLYLTADQAVIHLVSFEGGSPGRARRAPVLAARELHEATIRMRLRNGLKAASIDALEPLAGKVNYLLGKDPSNWITGVPTYARIAYRDVYRGIDLFYYGRQGALEYDFVAKPGADTRAIQVEFEGADQIRVSDDGDLILDSSAGQARWKRPYVYQEENGVRRQIAAGYHIGKKSQVGFLLAPYDHTRPLVIDPVLVYSTFLGGGAVDIGEGAAADATGLYTAGITYSSNFPTAPGGSRLDGLYDVFITKLNPQGSELLYSTYLGGSGNDGLNAFHLAPDGSIYLAGFTSSYDFPITNNAYSGSYNGGVEEAFVCRLAPTGNSLMFSTYIGGSYDDDAFGIALDSAGSVYVSGYTASFDFPATAGAYQKSFRGGNVDAFVTKLNATGTALMYSTFLGGSGDEGAETAAFGPAPPEIVFDFGSQIAVDTSGHAYVAGVTTSSDFPTTVGAYSRVYKGGGGDAFLAKLLPDGSGLVYSTLLGGSGFDAVGSVSVDPSGEALLAGVTGSSDFPITPGAFSGIWEGGAQEAFIAKFDQTGSTLAYSTFFGGSTHEAYAVAAMANDGKILLSGLTYSSNLPMTSGAYQTTYGGGGDVFFALFDPTITTLMYCTYLGTSAFDSGTAAFGLSSSDILVSGATGSSSFPTTAGAYQGTYGGGTTDAFIARFTLPTSGWGITKTHQGSFTQGQQGASYVVTVSNGASGSATAGAVTVTETLPAGLTLLSMSGTGWICTLSTSTCSRSDVLSPGSSYPTITVTVEVARNAASRLLNQVTVSGGGFPSATATDATVINAVPGQFVVASPSLVIIGFSGPPVLQTVTLTSTQPLPFTVAATALSGPAGWLTVTPTTGVTPATLTVTASAAGLAPGTYAGVITIASIDGANNLSISVTFEVANGSNLYYFSHLAVGGGFQTTLTYVNYSPLPVTCQTTFYSDSGASLQVPFAGGSVSTRTDSLGAGADIHVQTTAAVTAALLSGWAQAQCTGPVKASLLYRDYAGSVAQGEASVPATALPATEFVTFAQTQTGVAYANPSSVPATVTITALDSTGAALGNTTVTLQPNAHGAANVGPLLGLSSFTGAVQITSTAPIVSISLNAEDFPVFSSLPPGDLPAGTPLATGAGGGTPANGANLYYFPHLAVGGGFQTTLTYVNFSPQPVSCQTTFYSDSGAALQVPFAGGSVSTRTDSLGAGADIHVQTTAATTAALLSGWAQAQCTGPVKASLLYRDYAGSVAQGEASVPATTLPATEFVTFAQTQTGVAYANPSSVPATVTITALDSTGAALGNTTVTLQPNAHGAANVGPLLGIGTFTGSVQITATAPIVSISLNAEAFPVFSSLPPGDLPAGTPLATGTVTAAAGASIDVGSSPAIRKQLR